MKKDKEWSSIYPKYPGYRKPRQVLTESFRWMTPSFKTVDAGKNTIRIKCVAATADSVSRNNRKYVAEELKRAARTFVGKPVTINHNPNRKVGNVFWCEYEHPNLECLADIKKEPYVGLLRDHSTKIRGVSIEAAYLENVCIMCGDRFESEEAFMSHMRKEHQEIVNTIKEPHGIIGKGLSLVLAPEQPGMGDTTIELMESAHGFSQLCEMVIKGKGGKTMNKLGEPKDEHGCEPDETWDAEQEKCVKKAEEQEVTPEEPEEKPVCGEGEVYDPDTGGCVPIKDNVEEILKILDRKTTTQKTDFEKILGIADKNAKEMKYHIRKLEDARFPQFQTISTRLSMMDEKLETAAQQLIQIQKVHETIKNQQVGIESNLKETESIVVRLDNLEARQRGSFKGKSRLVKETKSGEYYADPLTTKKKRG